MNDKLANVDAVDVLSFFRNLVRAKKCVSLSAVASRDAVTSCEDPVRRDKSPSASHAAILLARNDVDLPRPRVFHSWLAADNSTAYFRRVWLFGGYEFNFYVILSSRNDGGAILEQVRTARSTLV